MKLALIKKLLRSKDLSTIDLTGECIKGAIQASLMEVLSLTKQEVQSMMIGIGITPLKIVDLSDKPYRRLYRITGLRLHKNMFNEFQAEMDRHIRASNILRKNENENGHYEVLIGY